MGRPQKTFSRCHRDFYSSYKGNYYCVHDMLDRYDRNSKTLSMARTTGYTCSIVTRFVAKGVYSRKGISPQEYIGQNSTCYSTLLKELEKRDVTITETIEEL